LQLIQNQQLQQKQTKKPFNKITKGQSMDERSSASVLLNTEQISMDHKSLLTFCRFRPYVKAEVGNEDEKKLQCCAAFHKQGKNIMLKVW